MQKRIKRGHEGQLTREHEHENDEYFIISPSNCCIESHLRLYKVNAYNNEYMRDMENFNYSQRCNFLHNLWFDSIELQKRYLFDNSELTSSAKRGLLQQLATITQVLVEFNIIDNTLVEDFVEKHEHFLQQQGIIIHQIDREYMEQEIMEMYSLLM